MTTLAFTQQLARRVGALLQREQARATYGYKHRNPKDWVSEVDTLSERTIVRAISRVYPAHGVLSEEAGLVRRGTSEYRWLIDPIDGTGNYVKGWPYYAVSLGLMRNGEPSLGVVYNPVSGELFWAEPGSLPQRQAYCGVNPQHTSSRFGCYGVWFQAHSPAPAGSACVR